MKNLINVIGVVVRSLCIVVLSSLYNLVLLLDTVMMVPFIMIGLLVNKDCGDLMDWWLTNVSKNIGSVFADLFNQIIE